MARRYVVAVDGSRPSAAALRWAVARGGGDGEPLVLVHVLEGESDDDDPEERGDEAALAGTRLLTETTARLAEDHPDLVVSHRLLGGQVSRALAAFVEPDDLLVIGTGKTGFLHGRVLGSRSVQIAMSAPCSVAVIPDVDLRFRRGVVAGVDRYDTAAMIAHSAAAEARSRGEELLFVQAEPERATRLNPADRADLAISEAVSQAHEGEPQLVIRSRVAARPPAEALLDSARDKALLVLGPGSGESGPSSMGSVVHDVLLNANAPVLIIHAGG
jgi:nucleotide-binding universal stress UspA family protein